MSNSGSWALKWFLHDGYLWDWVAAAVAIIINHVVPIMSIDPIDRFFDASDQTLGYPYRKNTIASWVLYLLTFAFPGLVFVTFACVRRSWADGHHALLSLAEGFALTCGWKRWMNIVGRLRPNWLAVLEMGEKGTIKDSRQAYPSGHSAYMFFSMTILSLWVAGKLGIFSHSRHRALFPKLILCSTPLWLATFVAVTRLRDYKHDFSDVNAGCFIGMCCGAVAYFLNFPSLFDRRAAEPRLRSSMVPSFKEDENGEQLLVE